MYREFLRHGAQRRTTRLAASSDQTVASTRRRDISGAPKCGRVGGRIQQVSIQQVTGRRGPRGAPLVSSLLHVVLLTEDVSDPFLVLVDLGVVIG